MTSGPRRHPAFRVAAVFLAAALAAVALKFLRPTPPPASAMLSDLSLDLRPEGVFVSDADALPKAEVISTVDGDTLRVVWEGKEERLRYYGANTPERDRPCFEEATRRNAALAGREVKLAFDSRSRDKYGRLLAYAFTPDGRSIEGALVAEGLARAWTRDGRWRDGMEALEREARQTRRGCLWSGVRGRAPRRPRKRSATAA